MATTPARPGPTTSTGLRPQVALIVAGAAALVLLAFSGVRAWRLDTARRQDLRRAESTLESFAELRRRYEPAVAAESIAWRRTWMQLRELGVGADERLSLTQRVTRSAEAAGLRSVRVLIEAPDTAGQQPRLSTEGVQSKSAPYSLRVECRGGLESVIAFLGQLPPSVAPMRMSLVRQDGRGPHRISLAVYELTFTNGVPPGWSSLERGNAAAGGHGRPGG
jgi:hypothetical protein